MIGWLRRMREQIRDRGECRLGRRGTLPGRFAFSRLRLALGVHKFEGHWSLQVAGLWVELGPARTPPRDMLDSWGFSYTPDGPCLHLNWGHRCKIVHMPWAWEWVRTEHGMPDGSFVTAEQVSRRPRWLGGKRLAIGPQGRLVRPPADPMSRAYIEWALPDVPARYREAFPFRYTLKSGEVQERTAEVTVERMTWARRLPWRFGVFWPKRVRTSIDVKFSDEVGERTGSWKGGVIGTGSEMRPGESPEQCLRRMERERKFA